MIEVSVSARLTIKTACFQLDHHSPLWHHLPNPHMSTLQSANTAGTVLRKLVSLGGLRDWKVCRQLPASAQCWQRWELLVPNEGD